MFDHRLSSCSFMNLCVPCYFHLCCVACGCDAVIQYSKPVQYSWGRDAWDRRYHMFWGFGNAFPHFFSDDLTRRCLFLLRFSVCSSRRRINGKPFLRSILQIAHAYVCDVMKVNASLNWFWNFFEMLWNWLAFAYVHTLHFLALNPLASEI